MANDIPCTDCGGTGYRSQTEQCFTCRGTGWMGQSFPGSRPKRRGSGGRSASSSCFVATAAYGSSFADQVRFLRAYRDTHLKSSRWGRGFILLYEWCSPPLARVISSRPRLRFLARLLIAPLAQHARRITMLSKKGSES